MTDEEAQARADDDPDAPPTNDLFWEDAAVVLPAGKTRLSLCLDDDVVTWLTRQGGSLQERVNAVLRVYMDARRQELVSEVAEPESRYGD